MSRRESGDPFRTARQRGHSSVIKEEDVVGIDRSERTLGYGTRNATQNNTNNQWINSPRISIGGQTNPGTMNPSLRIGSTRGQDLNGQQGTMNTSMMMNDAPFFSPGGIHTAGNTFYGPFNPGNDHRCIGHALCGLPNTPSVVTNTDNVPGVRVPRDDLFDIESTTPKPPSESPWSPFSIPGQAPPLKFSFRPAPAGGLPESSQGNVYQNVGRNQNSDGQADTDNRNGLSPHTYHPHQSQGLSGPLWTVQSCTNSYNSPSVLQTSGHAMSPYSPTVEISHLCSPRMNPETCDFGSIEYLYQYLLGFEQNPGLNLSTQNCDQDLLGQGSAEPQELLFGGSQSASHRCMSPHRLGQGRILIARKMRRILPSMSRVVQALLQGHILHTVRLLQAW